MSIQSILGFYARECQKCIRMSFLYKSTFFHRFCSIASSHHIFLNNNEESLLLFLCVTYIVIVFSSLLINNKMTKLYFDAALSPKTVFIFSICFASINLLYSQIEHIASCMLLVFIILVY